MARFNGLVANAGWYNADSGRNVLLTSRCRDELDSEEQSEMSGWVGAAAIVLALSLTYPAACAILAAGGWKTLRAAHAARTDHRPASTFWASARVGTSFYQLLQVGADEVGLYLKSPFFFLFHRPIQIPWSAITVISENRDAFQCSVRCLDCSVPLAINGPIAARLQSASAVAAPTTGNA